MMPWGYEKHQKDCRSRNRECTREWRVIVNKCAVVVCGDDKENPVEVKWKWWEEEPPIVDQYTYLDVNI